MKRIFRLVGVLMFAHFVSHYFVGISFKVIVGNAIGQLSMLFFLYMGDYLKLEDENDDDENVV